MFGRARFDLARFDLAGSTTDIQIRVTFTDQLDGQLGAVAFGVDPHGAELMDAERLAIQPDAFLREEDGAVALAFQGQGDDKKSRRKEHQARRGTHDIDGALYLTLKRRHARNDFCALISAIDCHI